MGVVSCRIQAATELLACGALKNRNVLPQGEGKGIAVVYQWTELGLRFMHSTHAIDENRLRELADQIASVSQEVVPPRDLVEFPHAVSSGQEAKPSSNSEQGAAEGESTDRA